MRPLQHNQHKLNTNEVTKSQANSETTAMLTEQFAPHVKMVKR